MKRTGLIIAIGIVSLVANAQNSKIVGVVCPQCGVYLKGSDMKNFDDPAYHKAGCTFVKKKESTKLKDKQPLPEVTSNYSQAELQRLYGYGNGIVCPYCGTTTHSDPDCTIRNSQGFANEYRMKAERATTASERERWLRDLRRMEDNINILTQASSRPKDATSQQPSVNNNTPSTPSADSSNGMWEYSTSDILQNHDKELSYGDSFAKAYAITAPNGTEHWVLINRQNEVVGKFTKVEFVDVSGTEQYVTVRDYNGKWGIYNRGGSLMCEPQYEIIKTLTPLVGDKGYRSTYFDVTQRDDRGVLKHGIFNPNDIDETRHMGKETIPCVCDNIELIDRSPSPHGVMAKIKLGGTLGIMDADSGKPIIQPGYSYVNTYFSRNGMYFIVGDGTNFGACDAQTMPVKETIPVRYTLDKVRKMLDNGVFPAE